MDVHAHNSHEAGRASGMPLWRYAAAGLVLLCVILVGYQGIDDVRDFRLVREAFPSLSAEFTTDLDSAILFSPMMLPLDRLGSAFLRWIQYPPHTLPYAPNSTRDPIGDAIRKAQAQQLNLGGALPLDDILHLKQSSIEAIGRAIYLSQEGSAATRSFENSEVVAIAKPDFAREPPIEQLRQIFEITYGRKALEQATQPER